MIAMPALASTRGPKRSEAAPLNGATRAIVIGTGVSSRPASIGEKPDPCSSRNGSRNVAVNRPANATTTLARPAAKGRIRNRARSIMRLDRRALRDDERRAQHDEGDQQPERRGARPAPRLALAEGEQQREQRDAREGGTLHVEGLALAGFSSGSTRAAQTIARSPIGALIRKIARQVATWVSSPPSAGPRLSPIDTADRR